MAAAERHIAEMFRSVVEIAAVACAASGAEPRILVEECFGLLNSGEREVMGLNSIAIILHHHEVKAGGVQDTDHNHRKQRQAPEQTDQD